MFYITQHKTQLILAQEYAAYQQERIHSLTAQAFNSAQHHLHILDPQSNKMKYCVSWGIYLGIRYMVHQKALCLHDKVHYQPSAPLSFYRLSTTIMVV